MTTASHSKLAAMNIDLNLILCVYRFCVKVYVLIYGSKSNKKADGKSVYSGKRLLLVHQCDILFFSSSCELYCSKSAGTCRK